MLFNSFQFAVFFPLVVVLYYLLPNKFRWALLLVGSYYFYMCWKVEYALLLVFSTCVDYYAALRMARLKSKGARKPWLLFSILVNLGMLFFFKYFNFFNGELNEIFVQNGWTYPVGNLEILLPMGISFYTFQTLSYTIDVYRGEMPASKHLGKFALYVTFFPQLVAGPVERAQRLLPQFDKRIDPVYAHISSGLKQMLWGFFKKLVIADNLALIVNTVYENPAANDWSALLFASYLFSIQAYCDFSGYTDIAIGASRVMGFRLMDNFRTPYMSQSIKEFWKRWHISLMTWFRDYIYIPMGGNRVAKWRWYWNILVVFLISGFWHGANWTFILFGGLHGLYILGTLVFQKPISVLDGLIGWQEKSSIKRAVNIFLTFNLVAISWFFFRAENVQDSVLIFSKFFTLSESGMGFGSLLHGFSPKLLLILFLAIILLIIDPFIDPLVKGLKYQGNTLMHTVFFSCILVATIILGYYGEVEFIYFQF